MNNISVNNLFDALICDTDFRKFVCKNITKPKNYYGMVNISIEDLKHCYKNYLLEKLK